MGPTLGGAQSFHGAYGYLHAACLYNNNPVANFITVETWVDFDDNSHWIEAGMAVGNPEGARRYFFWADQRPGGGYHEHDDPNYSPDPSTAYQFAIVSQGSGNFSVSVGSGTGGTSTGWGADLPTALHTGTETSGGTASVYGSSQGLGYLNNVGGTHPGWDWSGGIPVPNPVPTNWGFTQTVSPYQWYRYGTVTTSC